MRHNFSACDPIDRDVIVVGAGPAGLVAAITLARQGIDVVVVERHSGTSPFPKATGISVRSMEIFRTWGIEAKIRAGAMSVDPVMTISETLVGAPKIVLPFGFPTDEQALAVSPTTACCCPQDHLEPVLLEQLQSLGADVRFGVELVGLQQDDAGVTAEIRNAATGRAERIRGRYVIGADGPRSFTRDAVGIGAPSLGSLGEFVAVTFRAPLSEHLEGPPGALNTIQIAGAEGQLVPTGADDRWIYARQPSVEDGADWTDQQVVELLSRATGVADLDPEILSVMQFEMGGHVAETFRHGRTFLVGDAAHRTTPVGGTGMNTAIHGAHNLGWKMAWVLRGWAGEELLDSYEAERRPIATANVLRSLRPGPEPEGNGLARDIGVRYESVVLARATREDDENVDRPGDVGRVRVGDRAPHAWIERTATGEGPGLSILDLFEGRLTLLIGPGGRAWAAAAAEVARTTPTAMSLEVLGVSQDVHDVDGCLESRYRLANTGAVLVRPDGYVAALFTGQEQDARTALGAAIATCTARPVASPAGLGRCGLRRAS